ncbi:hypothetical protein KJ765_02625 [Candidatus Micrarchaeota archaeon]|nr:hypothetical protein [Candidatus Micrarchaeota archaeon]
MTAFSPNDLARHAWAYKRGNFEHSDGEWRVARKGNLVTVSYENVKGLEQGRFAPILIFPRAEHFHAHEKSGAHVHPHGPASRHLGSIGSLHLVFKRMRESSENPSMLRLVGVQGHSKHYAFPLPRGLPKEYQRWRVTGFQTAIRVARLMNTRFLVPENFLESQKPIQRDLKQAIKAEKARLHVHRDPYTRRGTFWVVIPSEQKNRGTLE